MLIFDLPPPSSDGQPLMPGVTTFRDHLDPKVTYFLPSALELLPAANGEPDFFLVRYHGDFAETQGGLLRFRLGFSALAESFRNAAKSDGMTLREVGFSNARFRLRLRSLQDGQPDQLGDWHPASLAGRELAAPVVNLTPHDTQFLEALLADAQNVVEVDLDLRYTGLVPGLPWLATADIVALTNFLSALLPQEPALPDQVSSAFLSLPDGSASPLTWRALKPVASPTDRSGLMEELSLRSLDSLFDCDPPPDEFTPPRYRLRTMAPADSPFLSWDLLTPRQETRCWSLTWSVNSLMQSLDTADERRKLFPTVSQVSPFAEVNIHVINRVPYDLNFLRKTMVDLRYSGPSGVPEFRSFTFDGTIDLQHFSFFYMAVAADFQISARFSTILAPPTVGGWPIIRKGDFVPVSGTVVEVNRAAIGMDFVRVEAEPDVFTKTAFIEIALYSTDTSLGSPDGITSSPLVQLKLTSDYSAVWVALPGFDSSTDIFAKAVVYAPGDPEPSPYVLHLNRIVNRSVRIAEYHLEVLDPDRIKISLDPQVVDHFALVRVTLAGISGDERTYTLQPTEPVVWNLFRGSVFEPLRYQYRLDYVAVDGEGHTLPITSTDWTTTQETNLIVRPPLNALEAHS
jgi:hypothetical protein